MTPKRAIFASGKTTTSENSYPISARFYDRLRATFLWGRRALVEQIIAHHQPLNILEVGCGAGTSLPMLARFFPAAQITGVDRSAQRVAAARARLGNRSRIRLIHRAYENPLGLPAPFDLVVFSYSLSTMNPGWEAALDAARTDLAPGGIIAVVDFHTAQSPLFRGRMNHASGKLDGRLLSHLRETFFPRKAEVHSVLGGLWSYLLFLGDLE